MGRLVAFDQQTASSLVARTRTAAQLGHGSPLRAALATEDEATLLMPGQRDQVLVVSVRRPPARATFTAHASTVTAPALTTPVPTTPPPMTTLRPRVQSKGEEIRPAEVKRPAAQSENVNREELRPADLKRANAKPEPVKQSAPTPPSVPTKPPLDDMEPVAYEATGFLGLEDSPVYAHDLEEQARNNKKKWWQKLLD